MAVADKVWLSFVAVAGWSSHKMPPSNPGRAAFGHSRSLSSILRTASPKPPQATLKPSSTSELPHISDLVPSAPSTPQSGRVYSPANLDDDNDMSTIPDPRSRAMSPANADLMASPHHPDLDQEVATLSTKLINAINHQTTLDDNLSATRMELENSRERIRQLERQVEDQREMLAGDVWVRRKSVEAEKTKLLSRIAEEKKARAETEQQKKKIEQELENLTAALFEEANKMVISAKEEARIEQEALQRKNDQLKAQLADTEGLLKSQQEQLAELKHVMEQMSEQMVAEREEQGAPTVPSSPGFSKFDAREDDRSPVGLSHPGLPEPLSPSYPTSFTHLLQPVLRTDLASYNDFKDLIRTSKRLSGQRVMSNQPNSGLTSLGLGLGSTSTTVTAQNGSNSSLSTTATSPATSPQTPVTPSSVSSVGSAAGMPVLPHLKETKFYKRALTEDIEPTLRLDTAPGLSWLARRSVLTAMTDGSLVVEPVPATSTSRFGRVTKPELYPCSLCGEARKDDEHLRTHRFRTSESGSAQSGYPLCKYCLARVRSTCDFLGFLRIVKDGHWRADDEDAEKAAWEESVRLREQMFWSRIGGGVVPTSHFHPPSSSVAPSPRPSQEALPTIEPAPEIAQPSDTTAEEADPEKLAPEGDRDENATPVPRILTNASPVDADEGGAPVDASDNPTPPSISVDDSAREPQPEALLGKEDIKRLSVTIPAA
ncbi:hypothetical protein QBC47DRAFT_137939 [Echria macrotheca]|uniref:GDP/GTP exchange factor Sec2 N-terminal domain-containing protein n=1 Tax=Echria macrotheca TaxID=438768 RepID=A0AAJ0BJH2_9PEZI|nr:hypothetical protein QBC47DRAFT_137939 [Echria macrotheca]